ncbi:MAG: hypothetical protein U0Q15_08765 [Kineosporiaceae bacterium]
MSSTDVGPGAAGRPHRPPRPAFLGPSALDAFEGGEDPSRRVEAAHATAAALVEHGRSGGDDRAARLVALVDEHGLDDVAHLWATSEADTLPGTLWRLYALRAGIRQDPAGMAAAFDEGRRRAPVEEAVAGVEAPPGPKEMLAVADAVLTGAFTGDLAVTLERAGAFCRVVATGWAVQADVLADEAAAAVTRRAAGLSRTSAQLQHAAALWRAGRLH